MNKERLKKIAAVIEAAQKDEAIVEVKTRNGWSPRSEPVWDFADCNYRVQLPDGQINTTSKDWEGQSVIWVREGVDYCQRLVITISPDYFSCEGKQHKFGSGTIENYTYSFDLKTWHPFIKEGGMKVVASTED
jgi:hypothetical protein